MQYTDSTTGKTFNIWSQTNSRADNIYLITNPKKGDMPWMEFTPYRKYTGIELMLNKRFSNKWQLMASYVYSKAEGNINNTQATGAGYNSTFENPNNQINAEGKLSSDYTHMLKIQGSVILPLDINLNINFQLISGPTYTMQIRLPRSVDPDRTYIYAETRGSNRYPTSKNLDLRLEKTVKFGKVKVGLLLDVFNVFNEGIVNWYQTLATNFEEVRGIVNPRAFRAGLRFWF
jgi:outer membrane usher protein FimD/PapC